MNYQKKCIFARLAQVLSMSGLCLGLGIGSLCADQIRNPQIAIDTLGNKVAIWELDLDSGDSNIYASNQRVKGSWTTPSIISASAFFANSPQLIVSSEGNMVAAAWTFVDLTAGTNSIAVATFTASHGWTAPIVLSTTNDDVFNDFKFSLNSAGQVVLIWDSFSLDTNVTHLWNSTLAFGGTWSTVQIQ